jgi:N-carbamoyl-L-amino-acid hydrolase
VIGAGDLERRLAGLGDVGARADGVTRLAWSRELAAAERWFGEQADELGLLVRRDPAGSLWACPDAQAPWWAAGSHLDSVRRGGRFDGPLGVAAAFEVAARCSAPVAVIAFADEEGARFNTPTFGSRALIGRLDVDDALGRTDDAGVRLAEAMAAAGAPPDGLADAPAWLGRLRGFLELHIDQTRDLERAGLAAGVVRSLAARLRLAVTLEGRADHAGTTKRPERRDALAAAARLIVAADELTAGEEEMVCTASRLLVEPNAFTTVPARVRLWLDARAPDAARLAAWHEGVERAAGELAERTGVRIAAAVAARSEGIVFDERVRAALRAAAGEGPELVSFAGHDAGIVAERLPAGMVFVRNPTGVSHSAHEEVSLDDAAVGAQVLLDALEELA